MRRSSMAAAAFLLLSGAALAQVSRTPDGKDVPYSNQVPANVTNSASAGSGEAAMGNGTAPSAGDQKTEPATPRR